MQIKYDPQAEGGQYLENLATAYWISDTLFTALDSGLFDVLNQTPNLSTPALSKKLQFSEDACRRFLALLQTMGLVDCFENTWLNSTLSNRYLVSGLPDYQGGNLRWRRDLQPQWETLPEVLAAGTRTHFPQDDVSDEAMNRRRLEYLKAMDAVIRQKMPEILPMLKNAIPRKAAILDVGAGSGGFALNLLAQHPNARATLMDIRQILPTTQKLLDSWPSCIVDRVDLCAQNILDTPWKIRDGYDVILLSNIIHATSVKESAAVLKEARAHLNPGGLLVVHDFFTEHWSLKSHLSDINMLVNTYNGRAFSAAWVKAQLQNAGLVTTGPVALQSDTALVFAADAAESLAPLSVSTVSQLALPIRDLGFFDVIPIDPREVVFAPFARNKCQFGCRSADDKTCIHNRDLPLEETRKQVRSYHRAFLLRGEPPTDTFQRKVLAAEALAFKAGCYKAFAYWAGPCSICPDCDLSAPCTNPTHHRPSMEGSGIDVFATVRKAGETLHTLKAKGEVIKYYALLLLE